MNMPMSPLVSALVSSIVSAIIEAPTVPVDPTVVPSAFVRNFPEASIPGRLESVPVMGSVIINGKTLPTAPGLQIRDESNRIVLSSMLTRSDIPVLYQMDATGINVWRIWILSSTEVAALGRSNFYTRPTILPGTILSR